MKVVAIVLSFALFQGPAAYVREGERAQQQFHTHRNRLAQFFEDLRAAVQRDLSPEDAAGLMRRLEKAPPQVGIYGYRLLPRIIDIPQPPTPIRSFSYSWPITEGYIRAEATKLDTAKSDLARVAVATRGEKLPLLTELVGQYLEFVRNQGTVDQYIEYNRFWQRSVAEDRERYDRMTQVYWAMKSGNPDTAAAIREILGRPKTPEFVRVRRSANRTVLSVKIYTDIEDETYLRQAKAVIEEAWRVEDKGTQYAVELDLRTVDPYRGKKAPSRGDHLDLGKHIANFPTDGGVLTTGAEFTHAVVGHYVALGPGDLSPKTLAHEFGHILGFNDGYIRGYTDLGEMGFEILELTAFFDDIMSAPREGRVQVTHFKLLMEGL